VRLVTELIIEIRLSADVDDHDSQTQLLERLKSAFEGALRNACEGTGGRVKVEGVSVKTAEPELAVPVIGNEHIVTIDLDW
jgi:hypothetical protein